MLERRLAEPFGLELVIAVREARIGGAHGAGQRIDDFALDAVGEMPCVRHVLKTAPAVGNLLVLRQGVGDKGENVRRFSFKPAPNAIAAFSRVFSCGSCIRLSTGSIASCLAIDVEAQARDRLVEQPVPGAVAGDRFFVEQLLELIVELIGLALADVFEPGPVMLERRRPPVWSRARRRAGSVRVRRTEDRRTRR